MEIRGIKPGSNSHGSRSRMSYGQNLADDRGKSGWSWLKRIQYGFRTILLRIVTYNQGQFAKLVIIDSGMIRFNTVYQGHNTVAFGMIRCSKCKPRRNNEYLWNK